MRSLLLLSLVLLVSCSDSGYKEVTKKFDLPEELKSCKIFKLIDDDGNTIRVVKCSNARTTTARYGCGKGCTTSTSLIED